MTKFEWLFRHLFLEKAQSRDKISESNEKIDPRHLTTEYRKILDKVAIKMVFDAFDCEDIVQAVLRLARLERIIIAFSIIQEMDLGEIASLLDTSVDSVYTQKHTALKRLKDELANLK